PAGRGIVDDDVDRAVRLHGLSHGIGASGFDADIAFDEQRIAAEALDRDSRFLGLLGVIGTLGIDVRDLRTRLDHGQRDRAAAPAMPACDEHDLSAKARQRVRTDRGPVLIAGDGRGHGYSVRISAVMTLLQRATASFMYDAKASGVLPAGIMPAPSSRLR